MNEYYERWGVGGKKFAINKCTLNHIVFQIVDWLQFHYDHLIHWRYYYYELFVKVGMLLFYLAGCFLESLGGFGRQICINLSGIIS